MNRKSLSFVCLVLLALLMNISGVFGQKHVRGPKHAGTIQHERVESSDSAIKAVQEFLGLTDDQVQKWREIQDSQRAQKEESFKGIQELENQLHQELQSANPSSSTVGDLMIRLEKAREQHGELFKSQAEEVKGILTADQAAKLQALEESWKSQRLMGALAETGFIPPPPPPPLPPLPPEAPLAPPPPPPPPPAY